MSRAITGRLRRRTFFVTVAAMLCAGPIPSSSAATSSPASVRFAIEGVGGGTFSGARLAPNPGSGDEQPDPLCLTLQGGSPDDPPALLEWMRSSLPLEDDGVASGRLPNATLTVLSDHDGLRRGVYRLSDVSVRQYRLDADAGNAGPAGARLEGVEISCGAVEPGPTPG
jgi:hypothetical protein